MGLSQVKEGPEKGVSERHVCSARVLGSEAPGLSRPVRTLLIVSESSLTSTPGQLHACLRLTSPTVKRGLLTPGQAPSPPSGPSTPDLVFHHSVRGPAAGLLNRDPPGPWKRQEAASLPLKVWGGCNPRGVPGHRPWRRVLSQSKSTEGGPRRVTPEVGGQHGPWKPSHRARPNWGDRNGRRRGTWGSTTHPAKRGLWHLPCGAIRGRSWLSQEATPREGTSSGQAEMACRALPFHR